MKKTNQEKSKKIAVFAGLLAAGVLAVTGICLCLHKEEPVSLMAENEEVPEEEPQVDAEIASPSPVPSTEEDMVVSTDLVISTEIEPESKDEELAQPLQQEPVKTEDEKPTDPPAEAAAVDNPSNPQIPAQGAPQSGSNSSTPQNGTVQDGKIYIEGFGWIDYNGGGTEGVQASDIYENGNTVGIMD